MILINNFMTCLIYLMIIVIKNVFKNFALIGMILTYKKKMIIIINLYAMKLTCLFSLKIRIILIKSNNL